MESLYRSYRPQTFADVVGQEHVVGTLERAVAEGRLSHAYLFCGPRGTGKTTMARLLAKALLCDAGPGVLPDGSCGQCRAIAAGEHPDVYELDAASRTGVDNVREEIIASVAFAPVMGRAKVYIIDEVHMLTTAAFNALLKTLEEPPEHVTFVLCTTEPSRVPETILSRVQRFDFHALGMDELVGRLSAVCGREGIAAEPEALELVARRARGGMRDALSSLEQLAVFGGGQVTRASAEALLGGAGGDELSALAGALAARDVALLFSQVAAAGDAGRDLLVLTRELAAHLRDVYVAAALVGEEGLRAAGAGEAGGQALGAAAGQVPVAALATTSDVPAVVAEAAAFGSVDRVARALAVLADASSEMRTAPNQRLVFEIALTRIARPESDLTLEALADRVATLEAQLAALSAARARRADGAGRAGGAAPGTGEGEGGGDAAVPAGWADGAGAAAARPARQPVGAAGAGGAEAQAGAVPVIGDAAGSVRAVPPEAGGTAGPGVPGEVGQVASGGAADGSAPRAGAGVEVPVRASAVAGAAPASDAPRQAAVSWQGPAAGAQEGADATLQGPAPAAVSVSGASRQAAAEPPAGPAGVRPGQAPVDVPAAGTPAGAVASWQGFAAVPTPMPATATPDLAELQRRWRQVVDELLAASPSRGSLLVASTLERDDGQTLLVTLPKGSTFAAKMLTRLDVQATVEPVVARAFGPRRVVYAEASLAAADIARADRRAAAPQAPAAGADADGGWGMPPAPAPSADLGAPPPAVPDPVDAWEAPTAQEPWSAPGASGAADSAPGVWAGDAAGGGVGAERGPAVPEAGPAAGAWQVGAAGVVVGDARAADVSGAGPAAGAGQPQDRSQAAGRPDGAPATPPARPAATDGGGSAPPAPARPAGGAAPAGVPAGDPGAWPAPAVDGDPAPTDFAPPWEDPAGAPAPDATVPAAATPDATAPAPPSPSAPRQGVDLPGVAGEAPAASRPAPGPDATGDESPASPAGGYSSEQAAVLSLLTGVFGEGVTLSASDAPPTSGDGPA